MNKYDKNIGFRAKINQFLENKTVFRTEKIKDVDLISLKWSIGVEISALLNNAENDSDFIRLSPKMIPWSFSLDKVNEFIEKLENNDAIGLEICGKQIDKWYIGFLESLGGGVKEALERFYDDSVEIEKEIDSYDKFEDAYLPWIKDKVIPGIKRCATPHPYMRLDDTAKYPNYRFSEHRGRERMLHYVIDNKLPYIICRELFCIVAPEHLKNMTLFADYKGAPIDKLTKQMRKEIIHAIDDNTEKIGKMCYHVIKKMTKNGDIDKKEFEYIAEEYVNSVLHSLPWYADLSGEIKYYVIEYIINNWLSIGYFDGIAKGPHYKLLDYLRQGKFGEPFSDNEVSKMHDYRVESGTFFSKLATAFVVLLRRYAEKLKTEAPK